jgi:uncharacterized protein (TIGR03067 family)
MKKVLLLAIVLIIGCDNSTESNSDTYSVSDLEGVWMGSVTSTGSALPDGTIIDGGYEFDSQGNLVDWIGGPGVLSTNGNLDISGIGDITGTTTTIHINGNNAEETTVCNWQGSQLVSINTIEVNMQCDWATNDGSSGSYTLSGIIDKSTEPQDCAGVAGGTAELDDCSSCDNDSSNDCIPDLEGTWIGNETNSNNVWTCSITGNEMDLSSENEWYKGTFSINTQTDPKQLDYLLTDCFISEGIGLTVLAIYKIENNSMTFAGNEPGATTRPDSFVGGRIIVLEKQ